MKVTDKRNEIHIPLRDDRALAIMSTSSRITMDALLFASKELNALRR